ncbi:iron-sulfur cluster assembly protein [Haladaptatus sp. F3-133]|jgi:FeS assembly SUF system protein|uniref:Iron-sulfur cluster assembly protein n=1 Tax=Halorutilus salinus TaxID=2487751 RepID=A0A9Q4C3Q4_9EURY|nr:iron-sulfur cluster assembly protein [Halorutilus salinus]MCX2817899.1 iron-sulfur cluster assembly protein [Halorutilus salinus]
MVEESEPQTESQNDVDGEYDEIQDEILEELESVHDPEIPVNIVDLGLIYDMEFDDDGGVDIDMTLTSMGCPTADSIMREVELTAEQVDGVENVDVELVWQPPWTPEKVSDEGRTQLNAMGVNI